MYIIHLIDCLVPKQASVFCGVLSAHVHLHDNEIFGSQHSLTYSHPCTLSVKNTTD